MSPDARAAIVSSRQARVGLVVGLIAAMALSGLLDMALPHVEFSVLLILPLLVSTLLLSFRTTLWLTVLALVIAVVTQIPQGELGELDETIHLILIFASAGLLLWMSWWFSGWRGRLRSQEETFRLLAENVGDLVYSVDVDARITWVSPSSLTMLGLEPSELVGRSGAAFVLKEDIPVLMRASEEAIAGRVSPPCRIRMVSKEGSAVWVEASPRALFDETGTLRGGVVGVRNVDQEVAAQEALVRETQVNSLTGLAKRELGRQRLQRAIDEHGSETWFVIGVGVNQMTSINRAYTFAAGDVVLRAVAERLAVAAGNAENVSRMTGDEFVIIDLGLRTATEAGRAAERILNAVRGPVDVGAAVIDVTCSVGVVPVHGRDAAEVFIEVSAAIRHAGRTGPDHWDFLDSDVGEQTRRMLALQGDLRASLQSGDIVPWYMPLSDLRTGEIVGYEALARWRRPGGVISAPDTFLPAAELAGILPAIDVAILRSVIASVASVPDQRHVAVNVSAATLNDPTFLDVVDEVLTTGAIDPARLHLEVTETGLVHVSESVRRTMEHVADRGVAWWVDDFGTGFSSISHLRDLPISGLKLDRSFTTEVTVIDSDGNRLAAGLAGLASHLGLRTVAEGVETAEQADILASQGWEMGQGWHFGKAAPEPQR